MGEVIHLFPQREGPEKREAPTVVPEGLREHARQMRHILEELADNDPRILDEKDMNEKRKEFNPMSDAQLLSILKAGRVKQWRLRISYYYALAKELEKRGCIEKRS